MGENGAEAALAAELQESRRRAEELQALLDAERRRAAEAETKLKEREILLKEAQRKPVDKELADKQRAALAQVETTTQLATHLGRGSLHTLACNIIRNFTKT